MDLYIYDKVKTTSLNTSYFCRISREYSFCTLELVKLPTYLIILTHFLHQSYVKIKINHEKFPTDVAYQRLMHLRTQTQIIMLQATISETRIFQKLTQIVLLKKFCRIGIFNIFRNFGKVSPLVGYCYVEVQGFAKSAVLLN